MNKAIMCLLLLPALVLVGCSSMGRSECVNADWYLVGFGDGSLGWPVSRLDEHRRACSRVDVVPDIEQYRLGHGEGVREYCTVPRAYSEGSRGATYQGVCPADMDQSFRRAYNDGLALYTVTNALAAMDNTLNTYYSRMDDIEKDIAELERAIVSDSSSADSRRENLDAIRNLRDELAGVQEAMAAADFERALLSEELQAVTREHRRLGYQ